MSLSRRSMVISAAIAASAPHLARAAGAQQVLRLQTRQIEVGGKAATRYGVVQASGAFGLTLNEGDDLDVRLENALTEPSGLHWHGLIPPWRQDGVPYVSAPPIAPGKSADFKFPARPTGTRWMHSHFGLQEQDLLAAPLIVRETAAIKSGMQEVVVLLQDFSWTNPEELFANLRKPKAAMNMASGGMNMPNMPNMNMANMPNVTMSGQSMGGMAMKADLNDITYDAFLANDRTLADPQVIDVGRNADVRLRIINGASSTNFMIDLGALDGTLLAVDGNPVAPLQGPPVPARHRVARRHPGARGRPGGAGAGTRRRPHAADRRHPAAARRRGHQDRATTARRPPRPSGSSRRCSCAPASRCRPGRSTARCRSISPAR